MCRIESFSFSTCIYIWLWRMWTIDISQKKCLPISTLYCVCLGFKSNRSMSLLFVFILTLITDWIYKWNIVMPLGSQIVLLTANLCKAESCNACHSNCWHSTCNTDVCHYYNYMLVPEMIWPADVLNSLHLIPTHVMRTHNNLHKSVKSTVAMRAIQIVGIQLATLMSATITIACLFLKWSGQQMY